MADPPPREFAKAKSAKREKPIKKFQSKSTESPRDQGLLNKENCLGPGVGVGGREGERGLGRVTFHIGTKSPQELSR